MPSPATDPSPGQGTPQRRVIVLAGASGSGKSVVAEKLAIPVVRLDDFYLDHDHPGLPVRNGTVDWDDAATWGGDAAVAALTEACFAHQLELPIYDIPTSRRTGTHVLELGAAPAVLAEGIFAAAVVTPLRRAGLLAGAYYLEQSRTTTAVRRFARDVGESRKPLRTLLVRGLALWRAEPGLVRGWAAASLEPLPRKGAEDRLRGLL